jgi:hypothetical protein
MLLIAAIGIYAHIAPQLKDTTIGYLFGKHTLPRLNFEIIFFHNFKPSNTCDISS